MDRDVAETVHARRAVQALVVSATSQDGLVRVSVGAAGDLRDIRLDPRIGRRPDGTALAGTIVRTAGEAATQAAVWAGDTAEAMVDATLAQIDRLAALPPPAPRADGRPVVRRPDLSGLRNGLISERERLRGGRGAATSPDGLIAVTVGGRGELIELRIDDRVFRRSDARWPADVIMTTARAAQAEASRA